MTPERWQAVLAVFYAARERPSAERDAYVDAACASDASLRAEVTSMLAADVDDDFLDAPAPGVRRPAPDDVAPRLGRALGDAYRVERELGGGGMSRVFVAEEIALGRRVVVKVLPPELGRAIDVERFRREVRLAASLRHPHVVPVLAAGESADGLVYYTMPLIEGESLRQRLAREGPLPVADVVRIVREVADALAYAHRRGVVHRDVKPANVLVDGDHVVVADFGIAKALSNAATGSPPPDVRMADVASASGDGTLTKAGLVLGTPGYMSPEQRRGDADVDARSDVYSFGCMAFELLTGARPEPERVDGLPAAALSLALGREVDRVLVAACSARREDRFETATAFADALVDALAARPPRRARWPSRRVAGAGVAIAAAAVIAAAGLRAGRPAGVPNADHLPNGAAAPGARPTVAVLAFANAGTSDDAYFADGVTGELTTRLAAVGGLRVLAPASTRPYRGDARAPRDVGTELGADYVLAGAVRRESAPGGAGTQVDVRPRLIRVRDGQVVWADRFGAPLADVFTVEGAIGARVAAAIGVTLSDATRATLGERPTASFEAYNYFLRAEGLRLAADDGTGLAPVIALYDSAIALDPRFALALARVSEQHSDVYWNYHDRSDARLALTRATAEAAVRLAPDLPEARLALGLYYYRGRRDFARAVAEFTDGLRAHPDNADLREARALVLRRLGRAREAIVDFEYALALDPRSQRKAWSLAGEYRRQREFAQAERYLARVDALAPGWALGRADLALLHLEWHGDTVAAYRAVREVPLAETGLLLARLRFNAPDVIPLGSPADAATRRLTARDFPTGRDEYLLWRANWHRARGALALARAYADSARVSLEPQVQASPDDPKFQAPLGLAYAFLGRRADAQRAAARAVALLPVSADANDGADLLGDQAYVDLLVGDRDAAVAALARLVAIPSDVSIPMLRRLPRWAPLRGHPGFERLIGGPAGT